MPEGIQQSQSRHSDRLTQTIGIRYVLYVPGRARPTFVSTNIVTLCNRCPMAKDSPDFINNGETVMDFPQGANVFDISSSSVDSFLDQTETHYILRMTNDSIRSTAKPVFEASFVRAQNTS